MKIERRILLETDSPYAVGVFDCSGGQRVITASNVDAVCTLFDADNLTAETVWHDQGGTMNFAQLNAQGDFLAIQRFYRGFNSKRACIARFEKREGQWQRREILQLPFVHRFCLAEIAGRQHLVCSTLSQDKNSPDDWNRPGTVFCAVLPQDPAETLKLKTVLDGIHKNHGFCHGNWKGQPSLWVSGEEGLFRLKIPAEADSEWTYEHWIGRPISDCTVCDLDGDGEAEVITIEPFHGNQVVISKYIADAWREVYRFPAEFAHAIWSGPILGSPALLLGYKGADAALLLLRFREEKAGRWQMDITVLDRDEGPNNLAVVHRPGRERIFSCNGNSSRIVMYELTAGDGQE